MIWVLPKLIRAMMIAHRRRRWVVVGVLDVRHAATTTTKQFFNVESSVFASHFMMATRSISATSLMMMMMLMLMRIMVRVRSGELIEWIGMVSGWDAFPVKNPLKMCRWVKLTDVVSILCHRRLIIR